MIYHCGEFTLNDQLFELRRAGQRIAVQPKVLDLLLYLIRFRARIVRKEEIFAALWGNVVISENVLTTAMHEARAALGDSRAKQWAIETIPGRGYHFVATVEEEVERRSSRANRENSAITRPESPPAEESSAIDTATARLRECVESAWAGSGHVVLLSSEPEIDRSRLIDDVAAGALDRKIER